MNTCRLHGSPKVSSGPASPIHHSSSSRLPNHDIIDDVSMPSYGKENRATSPASATPIIEHKLITPRRQQNHHQFNINNDLSSNGCCKPIKNKSLYTPGCSCAGGVPVPSNSMRGDGSCGLAFFDSYGLDTRSVKKQQAENTTTAGTSSQHHHQHPHQQQQQNQRQSQHPHATNKQPCDEVPVLRHRWQACPELHKAMDGVNYIADHTKKEEESTKVNLFSAIIINIMCL